MKQKIIALIPARGDFIGSQKRNLALIYNVPLIKFTIDYAKSCKSIDRVFILTNDQEVADFSKQNGAEIPFLLPEELTQKGVYLKQVLQYVINQLKDKPDLVLYLEPTHPFRQQGWIEKMISILNDNNFDHVFMAKVERDNFWRVNNDGNVVPIAEENVVREKKEPIYREMSGLGSLMKLSVLMSNERTGKNIGIVPITGVFTIVDIINEDDLLIAEQIYKKHFKR